MRFQSERAIHNCQHHLPDDRRGINAMCGHIQRAAEHLSLIQTLMTAVGLNDMSVSAGDFYPGGIIDGMILEDTAGRQTRSAVWWFLLDTKTGKPNYRYATFNARNLNNRLWAQPFKTHRCLVPATGIGESKGTGNTKQSYLMQGKEAFFLGGLYRTYEIENRTIYTLSIITRDPHPRFSRYHDKATPLFLCAQSTWLDAWLDPDFTDTQAFSSLLLHPNIPVDFKVTPVNSTRKLNPTGDAEWLYRDS